MNTSKRIQANVRYSEAFRLKIIDDIRSVHEAQSRKYP